MFKRISLFVILILITASCNQFNKEEVGQVKYPEKGKSGSYIVPVVDPDNMRIPFPNNLLIDQKTGKVNIPILSTDDQATTLTKWQLNTLDGFSTETTIYVDFTYPIDISSVVYYKNDITHSTVLLLTLDNNTPKFADISFKFYKLNGMNRLVILPKNVLNQKTHYIVLLKKGIKGENGVDVSPSPFYLFLKSDYPLYNTETAKSNTPALTDDEALQIEEIRQQLVQSKLFDALSLLGIVNKDDLLLLWDFTAQSITDTMIKVIRKVNGYLNSSGIDYPAVAKFDDDESFEAPGICVYAPTAATTVCGTDKKDDPTLRMVYDNVVAMGYPFAISWVVSGYFYTENFRYFLGTFNKDLSWLPEKLHFYLTIPSGVDKTGISKYSDPFPVIIYQHGITRNKKDMFVVANNFALAGFATIAIDLPDHGERREGDIDLNGDGTLDGDNFIDPVNLSTTRDRMRQAVVDQYILTLVIKNWNKITDTFSVGPYNFPVYDLYSRLNPSYTPMNGKVDLDSNRIYYVGHSLGAIIGGIFMAISPDVNVGVINSGGVDVTGIVSDSLVFGPMLKQMMASSMGLNVNTYQFKSFFYDFMQSARWIMGSGDPINYVKYWKNPLSVLVDSTGKEIKNSEKTILLQGSRYDYVVPDKYRDEMASLGGLKEESGTADPTTPVQVVSPGDYIQFNSYVSYSSSLTLGTHSLILTPAKVNSDLTFATDVTGSVYYLPYYLEMYNEINSFFATDGKYIMVNDKSSYLPDSQTCSTIITPQGTCISPTYQVACYLCSYWSVDLVYKK